MNAAAVVLTYRRPKLATQVVRGLVEREGLAPTSVLLVINGEGGLDDPQFEAAVSVVRLGTNSGPAGGFRAGLQAACARFPVDWVYLCEDDVGLFDLPSPRLQALVERVAAFERSTPGEPPIGGVVAYARVLNGRTGVSVPHRPVAREGFEPASVAAWGASLVSRRVVEAGVLPDPAWFFAYEDHDFWLRVRAAGFRVLLDVAAARATEGQVSGSGREVAQAGKRDAERAEPWRSYYQARNQFELRRRHGDARWTLVHLAKSARRLQLAGSAATRRAIMAGLVDGARGRMGKVDRYERASGEL